MEGEPPVQKTNSTYLVQCLLSDADEYCVIEGTVTTGFENVAKEECDSKQYTKNSIVERGRVYFQVLKEEVPKVLELRSIDHLSVVIGANWKYSLTGNEKDDDIQKLSKFVHDLNWDLGLSVWDKCWSHPPKKEDLFETSSHPKFRVTCKRSGQNHSFTSMEAACEFGGAVQEKFGWNVSMTEFDIEVILYVIQDQVLVSLSLNRQSLHKRNISYFGPTTLRASICFGMLWLARIKPGDVVMDNMCGGGSIPIEGVLAFPASFFLGGDNHTLACKRCVDNLQSLNLNSFTTINIDFLKWDTRQLPLRDKCIDAIVTDLPFGKRSGSKFDNRVLYPKVLSEMARVCRREGRAVLLTQDKKNMIQALRRVGKVWWNAATRTVNIGGLAGAVFILHRTAEEFSWLKK